MARPLKTGLDYFPLDTDIDQDDKIELIEAEFGLKGFAVIIKLFSKIYREHGYFYGWTDKERLLFAKRLGEKSGSFVDEVVQRSVKWGIFNESVFNQFQVLTSAAIQKRYFDATNRRESVDVLFDFLLVDISAYKNVVIVDRNGVNDSIGTQSKGKESKVKESKAKHTLRVRVREENHSSNLIDQNQRPPKAPSLDEVIEVCKMKVIPEKEGLIFFHKYKGVGWCYSGKNGMVPIQDWQSKLIQEHAQGWLKPNINTKNSDFNGVNMETIDNAVDSFFARAQNQ